MKNTKNMRSKLILLVLFFLAAGQAFSQEFKIPKNSGKLILNLQYVIVTGYEGEDLVFLNKTAEITAPDERAKGLKPLKPAGLEDNTGMGLHLKMNETDHVVMVDMIDQQNTDFFEIKVPRGISSVTINTGRPSVFLRKEKSITARSLNCSLEISAQGDVLLENNTGPLNVSTYHGNIEARFGPVMEGPISFITSMGYIDVTVPESIRATVDMATGTTDGNLFAAEELNIVPVEDARNRYDAMLKRVIGKINDGGLHLNLRSTSGNIYLRAASGL